MWTIRHRIVAMALVLLSGSCSMTPAYRRPNAALPTSWSTDGGGPASKDAAWWRSFGCPELDTLVARGFRSNFDLQAAVARIDEARGRAQLAGAPRYPAVGLDANVGQAFRPRSTNTDTVTLQATYEFDFWGKNRAKAASAAALADASVFDAQTVALTLQASIADTYFEVLALSERLKLAKRIVDQAHQVLTLIEARVAGGISAGIDAEQQKNAIATFETAVPAIQQELEQRLHQLAVLSGEAPVRFRMNGGDLMTVNVPRPGAGLPAALLERRPDIRAAEERLISANHDIGSARAAFFPSITLSTLVGASGMSLGSLAGVAADLAQPLLSAGRLEGQLRYDRAHTVELAASYRQTILNSLRDVEDALTAIKRTEELEVTNKAAVESARRASTLARAQLDAGTADFLTVLTTERSEYQAEDTLWKVRAQRLQAAVALFRALGGGFGVEGGKKG